MSGGPPPEPRRKPQRPQGCAPMARSSSGRTVMKATRQEEPRCSKNVIVGVDGHEGGRDAIALAERLRAEDAKLTLAYVYHGDEHVWRGSSPPYEATEEERTRELLDKAREKAGVQAQLQTHGSPTVGRGLHELAEAIGADLLVIGSSRRGLLGRVLIGDDTRAALNGAPCAVAIAPAGYVQHPNLMREIGVGYNGSPESEHALGIARKLAAELDTKLSAFEVVYFPARLYAAGLPRRGDDRGTARCGP